MSTASWSDLPPEIITDIFLRLPLKSLYNLRRVNRFCLHFISSPDFVRAHLKNSTKDKSFSGHRVIFRINSLNRLLDQVSFESFMLRNDSSSNSSINLVNLDYPMSNNGIRDVSLAGSCNGLVCVVLDLYCALDYKHIILWNPCTGNYKKLSPLHTSYDLLAECLETSFGFGYDESNDDYKVVVSYHCPERRFSLVKVCSSKRNHWKRIQDFNGCLRADELGKIACGKIHWIAQPTPLFDGKRIEKWTETDIISLDVASETFGIVERPSNYEHGHFDMSLGVLEEGSICLLVFGDFKQDAPNIEFWIMKEYGVKESWTKVLTISNSGHDLQQISYMSFCAVLPNGEILFWTTGEDCFLIYNPKDGSFRDSGVGEWEAHFDPVIYVQSLVSPLTEGESGEESGSSSSSIVEHSHDFLLSQLSI